MKTVFIGLVISLLSFFSFSAQCAEGKSVNLQFGIGSYHFQNREDGKPWNQQNTGLGIEYIAPGKLLGHDVEYCGSAGQIKNSEFGETIFAGGCARKVVLEGSAGKVSLGAFAGVMTYPSKYNANRKAGDIFPVILPTASACLKSGICVDATFIPKVQKDHNASAAILFMGRFPIKGW